MSKGRNSVCKRWNYVAIYNAQFTMELYDAYGKYGGSGFIGVTGEYRF
ncbi:MAG: hypothetical protein PHQ11_13760 [Paludibacter sp.]|nr:hypothetical protein [Paludibacter sp.]MDD4429139.1 hypothetical protein [Paludibacter sp.]